VMLVFQSAPQTALTVPDLTLEPLVVEHGSAKFDLTLVLSDTAAGLDASLEYNTDLFTGTRIERMAGHFERVLEQCCAGPEQPIATLRLLSVAEHQCLDAWNATEVAYPLAQGVHALFEAQVARTPEAVAVCYAEHTLSYAELNARANQLAHLLQRRGVGPEIRVGVCLENSLEIAISLLGILKAGGCYVPLDPDYPQDRLAFILSDAQVHMLLTQHNLADRLQVADLEVLYIDTDWDSIAAESRDNVATKVTNDNLAYIIYTSGSTGRPKGTMLAHRGACNNLLWRQTMFPLGPTDCLFQTYPFSFDPSVWAFFWPLIAGARVLIVKHSEQYDSIRLAELIVKHRVTAWGAGPSMARFVLRDLMRENNSLKYVFCGGEAFPHDLQSEFFQRIPGRVYNVYGPTEATIDATYWDCHTDTGNSVVPIGHPIPNTKIHILDAYLQPVPSGVPGQLFISGIGLARGYLNRPDLTAEKFIPDPFTDQPGIRMYKTGDLARYRADGAIEFIGRCDQQIKLRGFRIELGEIEAVLNHHRAVREAIVIDREDTPGDKRLVAYVVTDEADASIVDQLRDLCRTVLPGYMLPSAFVRLDHLPLSPNGKLDRKALPAPNTDRSSLDTVYTPPQTDLERIIAKIWEEALQVDRVGIHDNFFDLGGHSLLLIKVQGQLRTVFGQNIPMTNLFRFPTIHHLAKHLSQAGNEPAPAARVTSRATARQSAMRRLAQSKQRSQAPEDGDPP
jgi:amino acid adenylation domain-containing protein